MSIVGVDAKEERHNFAAIKDPNRVNSLKVKISVKNTFCRFNLIILGVSRVR